MLVKKEIHRMKENIIMCVLIAVVGMPSWAWASPCDSSLLSIYNYSTRTINYSIKADKGTLCNGSEIQSGTRAPRDNISWGVCTSSLSNGEASGAVLIENNIVFRYRFKSTLGIFICTNYSTEGRASMGGFTVTSNHINDKETKYTIEDATQSPVKK